MKIIENRKLFGKISVFDVIIILLVIAIGIFAYCYLYSPGNITTINKYLTTKFQIRIDNLPIGTNAHISKGDMIYDNETNVYVGKVVEFEVQEYKLMVEDYENNKFVEAVVPNRERIILTLETTVQDAGADLITPNNYYIKVGKDLHLRGPSYAGSGYIIQIDRMEDGV